jgi:hypothetical protein
VKLQGIREGGLVEPGKGFGRNGLARCRCKGLRRFHGSPRNLPPPGGPTGEGRQAVGLASPRGDDEPPAAGGATKGVHGGNGTVTAPLDRPGPVGTTGKCDATAPTTRSPAGPPVPVAGRLLTRRRSGPTRTSNRTLVASRSSAGDGADPGEDSPDSGGPTNGAQLSGAETNGHATGRRSNGAERSGVDAWAWAGTVHFERDGIRGGGPITSGPLER